MLAALNLHPGHIQSFKWEVRVYGGGGGGRETLFVSPCISVCGGEWGLGFSI